jgi:integrase
VNARADKAGTLRDGTFVDPTNLTLAAFLRDVWLPAVRGEDRKATTVKSYETLAAHHLIGPAESPHLLGLTQLQKLTAGAIKAHYAKLAASGRSDGRGGLSPASVLRVHATLSCALNDAVEGHLIARNPAHGVSKRLPRAPGSSQGAQKAWTAAELAAFLDSTRHDELYPLWRTLAMTGMRRGEALALRLEDFDSAAGRVSVSKNRVPVGGKVVESSPKTDRFRVVGLDPETVEVLRCHVAESHGEYLFTTSEGEPLSPNRVSFLFVQAVRRAALPTLTVHGLRHSHASIALRAGVPAKVMQERLGHATIAMTLDTYSHVIPAMDAEAAVTIADLVKTGAK